MDNSPEPFFYSTRIPFAMMNRHGAVFVPLNRNAAHPTDRMKQAEPETAGLVVQEAMAAGAVQVIPDDAREMHDSGRVWRFPAGSHLNNQAR